MKRLLIFLLMGLILLLAMTGVALAGTSPWDIYKDWEPDGDLDGEYSSTELQAYLDDPSIDMYADQNVRDRLDTYIRTRPGTSGRSTFPWTGAQIAAMVAAAVLLIGLGVLLRRSARHKQQDEQ